METPINIARKEKGIKIHELAEALGIDASLMSRIAAGKRKPSPAQLDKLCQLLGLDFHELLKQQLSDEVVKVIEGYPQLAHDVMQVAEERIKYLTGKERFRTITPSENIQNRLRMIDDLQNKWQEAHPLNQGQLLKLKEYFHTAYTHESNKIEGNTLTLQETHLVINEGITIGGKSVHEHLEAINHKAAIQLIEDLAVQKISITPHVLKQIHQLVLKGIDDSNAGVYRKAEVRISGSKHVPPPPRKVQDLMDDYFHFYRQQRKVLHPVLLAAEMHERLVSIHPFVDGNGRTSRLIMNLILIQHGYTMANLKGELADRMKYYESLQKVQVDHENEDFYSLISNAVLASLREHLSMVSHK